MRTAIKITLLAYFLMVTVTDWWMHSWFMLFSRDEVLNLDAMVTFLRTWDYTSAAFGGHPFDPVFSSGVFTNFAPGIVFDAGGSLALTRLVSTGLQTLSVVALTAGLLRVRGASRLDALVVGLGVWVVTLPVGSHDLRFINGGELWALVWMATGVFVLRVSSVAAAVFWGVAVWLGKIIYMPFALALLAATAWAELRKPVENGEGLGLVPFARRYGLAFVSPLLAWILLIFWIHGLDVVLRWIASYVVFIAEHAAGITITSLTVLPGWSFSVAEAQADFLDLAPKVTYPFILPVVAGVLAAGVYVGIRIFSERNDNGLDQANAVTGKDRGLANERSDLPYVIATAIAVGLSSLWFVQLDPTQWGRHWMPTVYVAIGLTVYCGASCWPRSAASRSGRLAEIAFYLVLLGCSWPAAEATRSYASSESWRGSYASACVGPAPLGVVCERTGTLGLVQHYANITCETELSVFHPGNDCMWRNRARFLQLAVEEALSPTPTYGPDSVAVMDGRDYFDRRPEDETSRRADAIYLLILVQHYAYFTEGEFLVELEPAVCPRPREPLFAMMAAGGLDVDAIEEACARGSDPNGSE